MSLTFKCATPARLFDQFKAKIKQSNQKGKIDTWEMSDNEIFFTHKAERWKGQAWFWAHVQNDALVFNIAPSEGQVVTDEAYSYYHGHLSETFLNHFADEFTVAISTSQLDGDDQAQ